jgi:hypothetical protein
MLTRRDRGTEVEATHSQGEGCGASKNCALWHVIRDGMSDMQQCGVTDREADRHMMKLTGAFRNLCLETYFCHSVDCSLYLSRYNQFWIALKDFTNLKS